MYRCGIDAYGPSVIAPAIACVPENSISAQAKAAGLKAPAVSIVPAQPELQVGPSGSFYQYGVATMTFEAQEVHPPCACA